MQCTIHYKVLEEIFAGKGNAVTTGYLMSSFIGVSIGILTEYNENLKSNSSFTSWFAAAKATNRFKILAKDKIEKYPFPALSSIHKDYLPASFYCGLRLIHSANSKIEPTDIATLKKWGTDLADLFQVVQYVNSGCVGDNPIETVRLINGGNIHPNVISKYFVNETDIIVYDKYINFDAVDVLLELFKNVSEKCRVTIISSANKSIGDEEIVKQLSTAFPKIQLSIYEVSSKTFSELHDRFIFLGNRYQIKFTKGIDTLYKSGGKWRNKIGDIIIEDNQIRHSRYEIVLKNGNKVPIRLCA